MTGNVNVGAVSLVSTFAGQLSVLSTDGSSISPSFAIGYPGILASTTANALMGTIWLAATAAIALDVCTASINAVFAATKAIQWWGCKQETGEVKNAFSAPEIVITRMTEDNELIDSLNFTEDLENPREFPLERL